MVRLDFVARRLLKSVAILLAIVVVTAFGFWADKKAKTFFYPLAPPMPPVVDEPMPEILDHLESVLKTNAPQILAGLQPGISADQKPRWRSSRFTATSVTSTRPTAAR